MKDETVIEIELNLCKGKKQLSYVRISAELRS